MSILSPLRLGEVCAKQHLKPLLVFAQGSGFGLQNLDLNIPQLSVIARAGFVVASVEYRSAAEAGFPSQIADVRLALKYLLDNAASLGADRDRVALFGGSSGAHTVMMVALTRDQKEIMRLPLEPVECHFSSVISFYAPVRFLRNNADGIGRCVPPNSELIRAFLGGDNSVMQSVAEMASPLNYIRRDLDIPPVLIVHGDEDEIVPIEDSWLLYQALCAAGKQATLVEVEGGGHGRRIYTEEVESLCMKFLWAHL
jgi:acetyl esterase/lipase